MATKAAKKNIIGPKAFAKKQMTVEDENHLFGKSPTFEAKLDSYEEVNHPTHYNSLPNGIECWDVTEHFPANVAMGMKHLWRAGQKPGQDAVKDYKKCLQYIQRQIHLIEGNVRVMSKHNIP